MALWRKAPKSPAEDEEQIVARYWDIPWEFLRAGVPLAAIAYFFDVKWVVAYGFFSVLFAMSAMDARLYDLITRLRRLSQAVGNQNSN